MLDLLPTSSMDSSIVTPVLIGVILVWILQETLGWGLTGLVVPGYLASILVIQPTAGALVFVEAVLTTLIVRVLSDNVPRFWPWTPFFGRERFYHIVMVAAAVRLALEADGGLLDLLSQWTGIPDFGDLNAIGLVLVPLLANTLWRTGLSVGIPRLGLPVLLTWALLEYVLLPYTNVSLSSFQLTYEDLALDFEGSAKAHLLVLVGATLAAAANLHWGWDMGGIIVPGLLTLIWLEPSKLLVTLCESVMVAMLLRGTVRLPVIRRWNLAGGRTLMVGFVLDYLLRTVIAWTPWESSGFVLSALDLQGFGYLLPTLMAVRMHQHREILRVLVPVATTSLVGFAAGSALGLGLWLGMGTHEAEAESAPTGTAVPAGLPLFVSKVHQNGDLPPASAGIWLTAHNGETTSFTGSKGALHARFQYSVNAVVVAIQNAPMVPQAAWTLATLGDTRGVLLCLEADDVCAQAQDALVRLGVTLWHVEAVDQPSRLRFRHTLTPSLTLREIGDAFGDVAIEAEPPPEGSLSPNPYELVMQLNLPSRIQASALLFGPTENDWESWTQVPLIEAKDNQANVAQLEHAMTTLVLDPWMAWYDTGSENAQQAAARAAANLGLVLVSKGENTILRGPFWRASLDRTGKPLVLTVPDEGLEPGSAATAETLATSLHAAAVVVDHLPHHPIGPSMEHRPAHLALERLVEHITRRHGTIGAATIRGMRDVTDPGVEVVLHTGRVQREDEPMPALAIALAQLLKAAGHPSIPYDGSAALISFTDANTLARPLTRAATGTDQHITVHASTRLRDSFSSVRTPGHPFEAVVRQAELPHSTLPLSDVVAMVQTESTPLPDALRAAHRSLVTRGRAVDLADVRWQARAIGHWTELLCTPELGCRWLRAAQCADGRCTGMLLPFRAGETVLGGAPALDQVLFESRPIPVAWEDGA